MGIGERKRGVDESGGTKGEKAKSKEKKIRVKKRREIYPPPYLLFLFMSLPTASFKVCPSTQGSAVPVFAPKSAKASAIARNSPAFIRDNS